MKTYHVISSCLLLLLFTMAGCKEHQPSKTPSKIAQSCCENGMATCSDNKNCTACKNCKYCKYCSKDGGSCGVCK